MKASTNQLLNVAVNSAANLSKSIEIRSSATYVTGSHNFKAGGSFFRGSYHRPVSVYGNVGVAPEQRRGEPGGSDAAHQSSRQRRRRLGILRAGPLDDEAADGEPRAAHGLAADQRARPGVAGQCLAARNSTSPLVT